VEITKATRYQLIKPLDVSWEDFGQILRDLSYHTTKMCNAAVQLYWEYHNQRLAYKQEHGKYPEDKVMYGMSFRNVVYHRLRGIYPLMASSNTSQTNQFALNRWKNDVPDVMRLQKSIPSFRLGAPIQVANANYRLYVAEGEKPEFRADVTLLGKDAAQGRFSLLLDGGDAPKKAIFRHIVDGTYKQGVMQIVRHPRKKKWFCIISFTFTSEEKSLDESRAMGVNFGSGEALCWAFNFGPKRGTIPAAEIEAAEAKIAAITARRRGMLRTAEARGHGRTRRLKPTESLQGQAANIRDAINHKYSRKIVSVAVGNRCGIIRLADTSGLELDGAFKHWPWAGLAEKIRYKAEEAGIVVETADAKKAFYTCSKCGYSHPENTDGNKEFLTCKNPDCEAQVNLQYNTAKNIAVNVPGPEEKKSPKKEKRKKEIAKQ